MPKILGDSTMEVGVIGKMQNFQFSGTRTEHLGATEYTLATIAVDLSGSVCGFENDLRNCLVVAVEACKKSPRANNLLLRVVTFSTMHQNGIEEIHGFKPLSEIDTTQYPQFQPGGGTPLNDAVFSGVGATNAYAKKLMDQDFLVNGIVFAITDGSDTSSSTSPSFIKQEIARARSAEEIESMVSVLIGINSASYSATLSKFQSAAGLDQYIDAGDATKGKLAKLANFVSQSVSSQSQSLGTGGPSQNIAATI